MADAPASTGPGLPRRSEMTRKAPVDMTRRQNRDTRPARDTRLDRRSGPSLAGRQAHGTAFSRQEATVDMGWGRLIFGQTFDDNRHLADAIRMEEEGKRDVALYLAEPHVLLSLAPQELFLDPSHTYRLWMDRYRPAPPRRRGFTIRRVRTAEEVAEVNRIYAARRMVPVPEDMALAFRRSRTVTQLVAVETASGAIIGTVMGVDHVQAFGDPEGGASLWALAVDPQASLPGVGSALTLHLAGHFLARGRAYMDLSVMHDNAEAIALYEKLGFQRVPVFCVKRKNPINEKLFIGPSPADALNPYARILVDEARRRGIAVEVLDAARGYFTLTFGGRAITCRESLTELTSAIAMSRCQDKRVTRDVLAEAGLSVPEQVTAADLARAETFLVAHGRVVVKPVDGEQGRGVQVDIRDADTLARACRALSEQGVAGVVETFVEGEDLRIIVIDGEVVAAAIRKPAEITANGTDTVRALIEARSRRRAAATGGESRIPMDAETERAVTEAGWTMDDVPPAGEVIRVRKTANLHTGGTIHDVTAELHPALAEAAVRAARALDIPVVGLDFMVPAADQPDYWIIEANERAGLANHEPQPTAERFIDFLFPQTATRRRSMPAQAEETA